MPTQTGSDVLFASMPSFRSIFKETPIASEKRDLPEDDLPALNTTRRIPGSFAEAPSKKQLPDRSFAALHQYRGSVSTSASDSTDSSPTTTFSTTDSSVMTEPSPGTSPESPESRLRGASSSSSCSFDDNKSNIPSSRGSAPVFELQRPITPSKKLRNLKNLAVNTSNSHLLNRAVTTAAITTVSKADSTFSAPPSPVFAKPLTPPRRRPSNLGLTIKTPAHPNKISVDTGPIVPPTPGLKRPNALRHFQSSPSLPLRSPVSSDGSEASGNGNGFGYSRPPTRGFSEIPQEAEEDEEMNFDVPQSREEKPASYPNGPICIYESGIFLYFEPTAEQASDYDVILNVASEVKNPFVLRSPVTQEGGTMVADSITTANKKQETNAVQQFKTQSTLSKLKSTEITAAADSQKPEYIHIPWEHNTDIVPDLYRLVKLIDERVQCGKRVLVHCQCGVSRSASLIVAYGLYKNPQMSVQEAYDAVKKRSRWIGPNMNLIMQLQEFRSELLRNANESRSNVNSNSIAKLLTHKKNKRSDTSNKFGSDRRPSIDSGAYRSEAESPHTAPLPPNPEIENGSAKADNSAPASAGPSSAPLSSTWISGLRRSWAASPGESEMTLPPSILADTVGMQYVDPKGHYMGSLPHLDGSASCKLQEPNSKQDKEQVAASKKEKTDQDQPHAQRPSLSAVPSSCIASPITDRFPMPFPLPLRERETENAGLPSANSTLPSQTRTARTVILPPNETANNILSPQASEFPSLPFGFAQARAESRAQTGAHRQGKQAMPKPKISIHKLNNAPAANHNRLPATGNNSFVDTNDETCLSPSTLDSLALESPRGAQNTLKAPKKHAALRPKYSSPSLREQVRLRRLQDEMEANLFAERSPRLTTSSKKRKEDRLDEGTGSESAGSFGLGIGSNAEINSDDVLLSPRATEFASNPFHQLLAPSSSIPPSPASASSFTADASPQTTEATASAVVSEPKPLGLTVPTKFMDGRHAPVAAPPAPFLGTSERKSPSSSAPSLSIITPNSASPSSTSSSKTATRPINESTSHDQQNESINTLNRNYNNDNNINNNNNNNNINHSNATTPTVSESDPRSPAQKGLSPIVRNIWDVL